MCEYAEIENIKLSNGKTIKDINKSVRNEVEHIYLEGWSKGISIPFWDKQGNFYLANPDGSEDLVEFNRKERSKKMKPLHSIKTSLLKQISPMTLF